MIRTPFCQQEIELDGHLIPVTGAERQILEPLSQGRKAGPHNVAVKDIRRHVTAIRNKLPDGYEIAAEYGTGMYELRRSH